MTDAPDAETFDPSPLFAAVAETDYLVAVLRQRAVDLNVEVRRRDEQITELTARVSDLEQLVASGLGGISGEPDADA